MSYIEREAVNALIKAECSPKVAAYLIDAVAAIPAADVRPVPDGGIGEMSDGYHTFNGLYYQRMVLFAALVNAHKDKAWKSWKHEDGELCFGGGWFIVGIDTPQGSYTYHYEAKDFDLFDCEELPVARHWDGHTEEDVTRLLSLPEVRPVVRGEWETVSVPKPQTNADRIRAMTDEELADFLDWFEIGDVDYSKTFCNLCDGQMDCHDDCLMGWLKQEVTDD